MSRQTTTPLLPGFDSHNPDQLAAFALGFDYPFDDIVAMLVKRCKLDKSTAQSTVAKVAVQQARRVI